MTSYTKDGTVGPWAQEKLDLLEKYLAAYTKILSNQAWCRGYFYIDAFAGAGHAKLRKEQKPEPESETVPSLIDVGSFSVEDAGGSEYIDGSPTVALNIDKPFSKYIFIEKNPRRFNQLRDLKEKFKNDRTIDIVQEDATSAILAILSDPSIDWANHRAVIFLDPFGMQVPWSTLEAIGKNRGVEIILNLPVGMAIQRLLPRSGNFSDKQREKLNNYFGSPEWEDIIYEKSADLFGGTDVQKLEGAGERLANWYQGRLRKLFGFAPRPRLIRNSQGTHLYYLLFAGPNKTGAKIASDIFLKQGDPVGRKSPRLKK